MSKICPNCQAEYSDSDNFCPKCGLGLVEKTDHKNPAIILGDANAISGGININQSKNVVTHDVHYHTTTIQERIKSEAELKLEATNLIRAKAEEILAEKGRIDMIAIGELRNLAIQQGIDDNIFHDIIKDVRSNRVDAIQELSATNSRYLHQAEHAIKSNDIECLMNLLPRLESMASISLNDKVQYLYHLTLSIFNPQKTIEGYEHQTDENYWRTFWAIISYIRVYKYADASRLLAQFDPIRYDKPEGDQILLEAYFNLMKNEKEEAQSFLNEIKGTLSEQLVPFLQDINSKLCNDESDYSLGELFESGFYFQWILQKYDDALKHLGDCYFSGRGVKINKEEVIKWYKKAAEAGSAKAMIQLGMEYSVGWIVKMDDDEAYKWYRKAAEGGDAEGMKRLGDCYFSGSGVGRNEEEGFNWYRKAAEAGDAKGKNCLGNCYFYGIGVDRSIFSAFEWYCAATDIPKELNCSWPFIDNFEKAQNYYNIWGMKYLKGEGVCKDDVIAKKLIFLSVKIGSLAIDPKEAEDYFKKCANQYRDDAEVCEDEDVAEFYSDLAIFVDHESINARAWAEQSTEKKSKTLHWDLDKGPESRKKKGLKDDGISTRTKECKTKLSSKQTAKIISIWALNADPNDLSGNTYGNDSSIIVHCHIQVDNMNGRTGKAVLTMSTNGVRFNKTESLTPNYDSCTWKDFRFPIYANDIINLIRKGLHRFLTQVDLYDDQDHCMASSSIYVIIKYSSGFFYGTKVEVV